jgi:hypothetical protein
MAVSTESIQFHTCDLCEQDGDEADMTRLYGSQQSGKLAQADVCRSCQQRPIADLIAWIERREHEIDRRAALGHSAWWVTS